MREYKDYCMTTNKHKRFMKRIYLPFCIAAICCMLCACSKTQDLTVSGTPGATIYTPSMQKLGTIDSDGKAQVTISKRDYYPYLLSQQNIADPLVPFALDFEKRNSNLKYAGAYVSCGILLLGAVVTVVGAAVDEMAMAGIGAGVMFLGLPGSVGGAAMDDRAQYYNHFKYLPNQSTNNDFRFTPITDNGFRRQVASESKE